MSDFEAAVTAQHESETAHARARAAQLVDFEKRNRRSLEGFLAAMAKAGRRQTYTIRVFEDGVDLRTIDRPSPPPPSESRWDWRHFGWVSIEPEAQPIPTPVEILRGWSANYYFREPRSGIEFVGDDGRLFRGNVGSFETRPGFTMPVRWRDVDRIHHSCLGMRLELRYVEPDELAAALTAIFTAE